MTAAAIAAASPATIAWPAPLELDGSLEQRDELAELILELEASYTKLRADRARAKNVLRNMMQAAGTRSFTHAGATFELRSASAFWCATHSTPPPYCRHLHAPGDSIPVREVVAEPYVLASHPKTTE